MFSFLKPELVKCGNLYYIRRPGLWDYRYLDAELWNNYWWPYDCRRLAAFSSEEDAMAIWARYSHKKSPPKCEVIRSL